MTFSEGAPRSAREDRRTARRVGTRAARTFGTRGELRSVRKNGQSPVRHGQLSQWNGERRHIGKLGREFDVEDGQRAAKLCALNVIAQHPRRWKATSIASPRVCESAGSSTRCRTSAASRR